MSTNRRLLDFKKLTFEVRDVMRYDDVGDYFDDTIVAYDFGDDVITNAIFLHEFVEYMLIKSSGIDPKLIDMFDTEEGAEEKYPREYKLYEEFHDTANRVERKFIENLGINWEDYDKTIYSKKVKTAMQKISDELHKKNPDEQTIDTARGVVRDILEPQETPEEPKK